MILMQSNMVANVLANFLALQGEAERKGQNYKIVMRGICISKLLKLWQSSAAAILQSSAVSMGTRNNTCACCSNRYRARMVK